MEANGIKFIIDSPTKTSKVGKPHVKVHLTAYPNDPLLCVMKLLKIYLEKTRPIRGTERRLFLSYTQPHKAVGAETISRWIKSTLKVAGVNTDKFTAHSTRAAACSAASRHGVPLDVILKTAGWARCSTFATFYDKPLEEASHSFAEGVLGFSNV